MKLSKETTAILKNFTGINTSILIQGGSVIRTSSNAKNIYGTYHCEEEFPVNIPLYDLNNFLSSLSLFDDANIEFKENFAVIEGESSNMKYVYPYEGQLEETKASPEGVFDNPRVTFDLTSENFTSLLRASNVLESNVITISSNDDKIVTVTAHSNINSDANRYEVLSNVTSDETFSVVLMLENLKMLPSDYTVKLFDTFALFQTDKLEYVVASEHESTWG